MTATMEERVAGIAERVGALERDIGRLASTPEHLAEVRGDIKNIKQNQEQLTAQLGALTKSIDDREEERSNDQRSLKIALLSLTAIIAAALIAAAATIIAAGMHP